MGCGASRIGGAATDSLPASLTEFLERGVSHVAKAVDALGTTLPFPGPEAAGLLVDVLALPDRALADHANLEELRRRAVALLELLRTRHPALVRAGVYKGLVAEYRELLMGILAYGTPYCSRNCLVELFAADTASKDGGGGGGSGCRGGTLSRQAGQAQQFEELCRSLGDLAQRTVGAMQGLPGEVPSCLQQSAQYQDLQARAQQAVADAGGLNALLHSGDNPGLVEGLLSRIRPAEGGIKVSAEAALAVLRAAVEAGPHRHIRQPELRTFWKEHFAGEAEVPWFAFFEALPKRRHHNNESHSGDLERLCELLRRSEIDRRALQAALHVSHGNDKVSVYALRTAFNGDQPLWEQVQQILAQQKQGADSAAQLLVPVAALGSSSAKPSPSSIFLGTTNPLDASDESGAEDGDEEVPNGKCMLPPVDPTGCIGRGEQARQLAERLMTHGSVVLVGPGGVGKSALAAQTGWLLYGGGGNTSSGSGSRRRRGLLPGGALWVDLREARSAAAVEARFCAALGIYTGDVRGDQGGVPHRVMEALRRAAQPQQGAGGGDRHRRGQHLRQLLVVDGAQDALGQEDAAKALRAVLQAVAGPEGVEGTMVLVTSRVPLLGPTPADSSGGSSNSSTSLSPRTDQPQQPQGKQHQYQQVPVDPLTPAAAMLVVQEIAQDLSPQQAEVVAAACRGVPLILRLVSEALAAGRLMLEDVKALARPRSAPRSPGTSLRAAAATDPACQSADDPLLVKVLQSLKPAHRAALEQLAVFPSAFDDEAVAAVLQVSHGSARALLAGLCRSGVLELLRSCGDAGGGSGRGCGAYGWYALHGAVRQAVLAGVRDGGEPQATALSTAEGLYGMHMLRQLGQWATMYDSSEFSLALAMARDRQADVSKVAELLAQASAGAGGRPASSRSRNGSGSSEAAARSSTAGATASISVRFGGASDAGLFEALRNSSSSGNDDGGDPFVATALSYKACPLLEALGMLSSFEAGWQAQMAAAEEAGDIERQACYLILLARVSLRQGPYTAGLKQAQLARDLLLGSAQTSPVPRPRSRCGSSSGGRSGTTSTAGNVTPRKQQPQSRPQSPRLQQQQQQQQQPPRTPKMSAKARPVPTPLLLRHSELEAAALTVLAQCLEARGSADDAEPLLRQALGTLQRETAEIVEEGASPAAEHPDSVGVLRSLARCVRAQGRVREAEELYRRLVHAANTALSGSHPDTAVASQGLADCLAATGSDGDGGGGGGCGSGGCGGGGYEAEILYRSALEVQRRVLGDTQPRTLALKASLARCLKGMREYGAAEELAREALTGQERVLGQRHPDMLGSLATLAGCLMGQYRCDEAEELYGRMLSVWSSQTAVTATTMTAVTTRGSWADVEVSEETLASMMELAECVCDDGRHKDAEAMYRHVLKARLRALGSEHAATLAVKTALARCLLHGAQQQPQQPLQQQLSQQQPQQQRPERQQSQKDSGTPLQLLEAQGLLEAVAAVQRRVLGQVDAAVQSSLETVTAALGPVQGRCSVGLLQAEAEAKGKRRSGLVPVAEDPDLLGPMTSLEACLAAQGLNR